MAAVLVAFLLQRFVVQAFYIPSGSMETTLSPGDRVLVNKVSYDLHDVHRGDIVVFSKPAIGYDARHQGSDQAGHRPARGADIRPVLPARC